MRFQSKILQLYKISKHFSRYGVQECLEPFWLGWLFSKQMHPRLLDLPHSHNQRLKMALETGSVGLNLFACFASKEQIKDPFFVSDQNSLVVQAIPATAYTDFADTLKILYHLAFKKEKIKGQMFVESFERACVLDARLSGASLERLNECFLDDLFVPQVDWINTNQAQLVLLQRPTVTQLQSHQNFHRLALIYVTLLLRYGVFIVFDISAWGEHKECLSVVNVMPEVMLTPADRRAVFVALKKHENFEQVIKHSQIIFLQTNGYTSFYLEFMCNTFDKITHQARLNGIKDVWSSVDLYEFKSLEFVYEKKQNLSSKMLQLSDIQQHKMDLKGQLKSHFLSNLEKIPDMIKQGEAGYKFRFQKTKIKIRTVVFILIFLGLLFLRYA